MEQNTEQSSLSEWLDSIQQDSWQLELIISGFVIFLMIGAWTPVNDLEFELAQLVEANVSFRLGSTFYYTLRVAYQVLLGCLIIHVILRGLWIAAVGLRSVSGEIEYDQVPVEDRYRQFLRGSTGSFDGYIERLERNCSIVFSVAFLLFFCFLSIASFFTSSLLATEVVNWITTGKFRWGYGLGSNYLGLIMLVLGLVYFIDFATLGFFKRYRYTHHWYYYFYRFMGWITLARFYRPLYYNLIDQRFGRRLARLLPILVLLFFTIASLRYSKFGYYPFNFADGKAWVYDRFYDDESEPKTVSRISIVTLGSKYPVNDYVEVFAPYRPYLHDPVIRKRFPELEVGRFTGVKLRGGFNIGAIRNEAAVNDSLLRAIQTTRRLYLNDSLVTDIPPRYHFHLQREQPGLLYTLPVHQLPVGEHYVRVDEQRIRNDSIIWKKTINIYFYK